MRRWVIRSANAVLFVVGCFLTAYTITSVLAEVAVPTEAEIAPVLPVVHDAGRSWSEREAILERNLFGARLAGEQGEGPPSPEDLVAVETKLPLELLGTVASELESLSNAAIMDRGSRKHQVVFVGDTLEGHPKVRVVGIRRATVFLQNGAKRERLDLHEEGEQARSPTPPRARSRRTAARSKADGRRRNSIADRIEQLQKQAGGRTTASLYSQARIVPEWSEGEMVGVRLNQVKPGSLYEKLGIESGDVITALNGIAIDSPQASSRLLSEFTQAEEFTIELQDGQVIEVGGDELAGMLGDDE